MAKASSKKAAVKKAVKAIVPKKKIIKTLLKKSGKIGG